jgi:hypothetical protein
MAELDNRALTPDPPRPPGAPELPDLDVDPEQFLDGGPDTPPDEDVNPDAAAPEPA